jgi:hypothetical protein
MDLCQQVAETVGDRTENRFVAFPGDKFRCEQFDEGRAQIDFVLRIAGVGEFIVLAVRAGNDVSDGLVTQRDRALLSGLGEKI